MTRPAVTVILPFLNAAATLPATLDSIAAQDFGDFELVAVDDGGHDGSADLVRAYAARDPRVRLLQPGHQGVVGAMQSGVAAARAPLVARMDADDIMYPQRLARQKAFLDRHPEVAMVGTRVRLIPEASIRAGFREYVRWQNACVTPGEIAEQIYVELPLANPTVMYRKHVVEGLGGYRDGPFPEDYELQLRLVHHGVRLAKVPEVLLDWRESAGRLTRTDPRYAREAFDQVRAAYLRCDPRLRGRELVVWGAGRRTRRRAGRLFHGRLSPVAYVDVDPRKIGNRLNGIPVVPPEWLAERGPRPLVLCYVANHGARDDIARQLTDWGYRAGSDFLAIG